MKDEPEFDPDKEAANLAKHGLSLDAFPTFDVPPFVEIDDRKDYGESRFRAFGRVAGRSYAIVFVIRVGRVRLISFRRAHDKEMRRYDQ